MNQVNLLPPEILQRQKLRRATALVAGGGALVLLLILGLYLMQSSRLASVNDDIAAQDAQNAQLQAQIAELQPAETLQTQAQEQEQLLASAWQGEVSFSGILMDVSRVIPSDMVLTGFTAQTTAPAAGGTAPVPTTTGTNAFVGGISVTADAASIQTVASWLTRLESVKGWENPWVSTGAAGADGVRFTISSTVDLSDEVVTARGRGETPGGTAP